MKKLLVLMGVLGVCCLWWVLKWRAESDEVPRVWLIQLASRTLSPSELKGKFGGRQTPTARGTLPCIVVARTPITGEMRARVASCGARVLGFLPMNALTVEVDAASFARLSADAEVVAVGEFAPTDKIQPGIWGDDAAAIKEVTIEPLAAEDMAVLRRGVAEVGGEVLEGMEPTRRRLDARLSLEGARALSARGEVRWIERRARAKLMNNVAVNAGLMNVRDVWNVHGLTGRGQNLTMTDTGVDKGVLTMLCADLTGRVYRVRAVNAYCQLQDTIGHGTHIAGSIVGNGAASEGEIRGVAPEARLYAWAFATSWKYLYLPENITDLFAPQDADATFIHSASWGDDSTVFYNSWCVDVDEYAWRNPHFLAVFAAGNGGHDGTWQMSISAPANAKNVLAVGATQSYRPNSPYNDFYADASYPYPLWTLMKNPSAIAAYSSLGPTPDGRIKPDIVAPGTGIVSVRSTQANYDAGQVYEQNPKYVYLQGTSQATPLVAGAAALVRQWLVERRGYDETPPTAALVKAVLLGGAYDMSRDEGAVCGGAAPNNAQGWGRVDVGEALYPTNATVKLVDRIPFAQDAEHVVRLSVTRASPLEVQLVWFDHPGDPAAAKALVNDLDLVVSNPTTGAVWLGNDVSGQGRRDEVNTVESVRLAWAEPGVYEIRVKGRRVPYDFHDGGAAALYVRGAVEDTDEKMLRLRRRLVVPAADDADGPWELSWYPEGTVIRLSVPEDVPNLGARQRVGRIEIAESDADEWMVVKDAAGRMPESFTVTMERSWDVSFHAWDVAATNAASGLPEWWYNRYLREAGLTADQRRAEADADGDGMSNAGEFAADTDPLDPLSDLRILALTPTNIVWRGGRERMQVVERAEELGEIWTGVFTNLPPTATEGSCPLPSPRGGKSFYRIRAF